MKDNRYCIIMAGGVGSRFWPMSRSSMPKQFIDILGTGETLLQSTYRRALRFCNPDNILIVTNEKYIEIVKKQLPDLPCQHILAEPVRRDTAPCVAYASYKISLKNPDAVTAVLPSDHMITKETIFYEVMEEAFQLAAEGKHLLTLGIKPLRPDTGYGYIQFDEKGKGYGIFKPVKTFTEKPNVELAQTFIDSGDFVWNSGMFIWSVKAILESFDEHLSEIISLFRENPDVYYTENEQEYINTVYTQCRSVSIDYGIMEKADNVLTAAADAGWSDLGTWTSLFENLEKTSGNNAITGKNVMLFETKNCIINAPQERLLVIGNVKDLIISEYEDMLLICRKDEEQKIKHFVDEIRLEKGDKYV